MQPPGNDGVTQHDLTPAAAVGWPRGDGSAAIVQQLQHAAHLNLPAAHFEANTGPDFNTAAGTAGHASVGALEAAGTHAGGMQDMPAAPGASFISALAAYFRQQQAEAAANAPAQPAAAAEAAAPLAQQLPSPPFSGAPTAAPPSGSKQGLASAHASTVDAKTTLGVLKRKASRSLPSSPGMLSPAGYEPIGPVTSQQPHSNASSLAAYGPSHQPHSNTSSLSAPQLLKLQGPPLPQGCFSNSSAGGHLPPASAAARGGARDDEAAAFGDTPAGNAAYVGQELPSSQGPQAWKNSWSLSADTGAVALQARGFPTRALPEPLGSGHAAAATEPAGCCDSTVIDSIEQQMLRGQAAAAAAGRAAAMHPHPPPGGASRCVSHDMAAVVAAAAAAAAAEAEAAAAQAVAVAMTGAAAAENDGMDMAGAAAMTAASAAAVGDYGMDMDGEVSPSMAAAAAAMAGLAGLSGCSSTQHRRRSAGRTRAPATSGKASTTIAKKPSLHNTTPATHSAPPPPTANTAAAAPAVAAVAAAAAGHVVGGGLALAEGSTVGGDSEGVPVAAAPVPRSDGRRANGGGGRSSTSNFRGVTQHRYTHRWEAHLWDPDAPRSKTAGSSRTRGRQTYLGGYSTEAEAARAFDRAALVYWGANSVTNFPKEDYAGELPQLALLQRGEVVAQLRAHSHAIQKFEPTYPGVVPHQALPGLFEARLADVDVEGAAPASYTYLGAFTTQEAAHEALTGARNSRRQAEPG